jgi:Holliday junction resolvase-like predicted endonuclease
MAASFGNRKKPFAPWKAEFRIAAVYWIIGLAWFAAALLWCVRDHSLASEATAEGAVLPVLFGFLRSESASRRKYGDMTEKKWVAKFRAAAPPDWNVEHDIAIDHLGNVDLLTGFPNGRRCPIEIKSWRSTGYRLRFNRALRQVRRQRDALLAQNAVLWLPEAKIRNAGYQRDIVVVQGDEHFLIECLRKLKYRFVIRFPEPPPRALREQLWKIPFQWKPRAKQWEGRCREALIDPIRRDDIHAIGALCFRS